MRGHKPRLLHVRRIVDKIKEKWAFRPLFGVAALAKRAVRELCRCHVLSCKPVGHSATVTASTLSAEQKNSNFFEATSQFRHLSRRPSRPPQKGGVSFTGGRRRARTRPCSARQRRNPRAHAKRRPLHLQARRFKNPNQANASESRDQLRLPSRAARMLTTGGDPAMSREDKRLAIVSQLDIVVLIRRLRGSAAQ